MKAFINNDEFYKLLKNAIQDDEIKTSENSLEKLCVVRAEDSYRKKTRTILISSSAILLTGILTVVMCFASLKKNDVITVNFYPVKKNVLNVSFQKITNLQKEGGNISRNSIKNIIAFAENSEFVKKSNRFNKSLQNQVIATERSTIDSAGIVLMDITAKANTSDGFKITKGNPIINKSSDTLIENADILNATKYNKIGDEFHITVQYTYNNTWILNQNTYGQFAGKELAYHMDFGSAIGLMAGYDVKRAHGFQAGIIFRSIQGQKYHDSFGFGQFDREINFEYIHIPVMYKLKFFLSNSKNPIILNFIIGVQFGQLLSANETLNGINTNIIERFHKNEIGLILNIESDFYLNNFLYFTFGLNSSIGNNINAKDWPVKDDYKMSHNFLLGMNFGLSYYFEVNKNQKGCSKF